MNKLIEKIGLAKMFIQRSMGYITLINGIMIIFLTISNLKQYGIYIDMKIWLIPIIIFLIVLLIFLGWIEDKLGVFRSETYSTVQRNPYLEETVFTLREIKGELLKKKSEIMVIKEDKEKEQKLI